MDSNRKFSTSSLVLFGAFSFLAVFEGATSIWNSQPAEQKDNDAISTSRSSNFIAKVKEELSSDEDENDENDEYRFMPVVENEKSPITIESTSEKPTASLFDKAASQIYFRDVCNNDSLQKSNRTFDLATWDQQTKGGLVDEDRLMLARYYGGAQSVFEWGLGESSFIAGNLNVPRYAGVDSDASWVSLARDKCPNHFRLSFADVGATENWGNPVESLPKAIYDYVIAPLHAEHCPFDVYMVDGRFRVACGLFALLHADRHGHDATILMHDYTEKRKSYLKMERVCDVVEHSGSKLVALKRKANVTTEEIYDLFLKHSRMTHR